MHDVLQDALIKQHSGKPLESKIESAVHILKESHEVLKAYRSNPVRNISYIEGIAGIRFAMGEVATLLHCLGDQEVQVPQQLAFRVLQVTEEVCTDPIINTTNFIEGDVVGPALYLLKLLVRKYGFTFLKQVSEEYRWILPEGLHTANQVIILVVHVWMYV